MNRWINKNIIYNGTLLLRREWIYPYLGYLEKSQWLEVERINEVQEKRLSVLTTLAKASCSHYKETLPDKVSLSSLRDIPLVNKKLLRNAPDSLRAGNSNYLNRNKTTGGSTGAPVTIYKNSRAMAEELAAAWRGFQWAGVAVGDRQARFWGIPASQKDQFRAKLIDFICNRYRASAFERNRDAWFKHYSNLVSFQPDYFYGYTSIIKEFCDFIQEEGLQNIHPKSIITTSEVLSESVRNHIKDTFDVGVFNEYGCGEVGTIAHECEHGNLHINAENIILEIVGEDGTPVPDGEKGEILVTDLSNTAMPLIRYQIADWGALSDKQCPCGRTLPVLKNIYGREYDSFINGTGKRFHGEFFLYIIEDANKSGLIVDGVQFVQKKDGSLLVLLVCLDDVYEQVSGLILSRLRENFDPDVVVDFKKVSYISREKSGKLRVVKREVS